MKNFILSALLMSSVSAFAAPSCGIIVNNLVNEQLACNLQSNNIKKAVQGMKDPQTQANQQKIHALQAKLLDCVQQAMDVCSKS